MIKSKSATAYKAKMDFSAVIPMKTTPFIDKYVAFLEAMGFPQDDIVNYKNNQYNAILKSKPTMPHVDDKELLAVADKYIATHKMAGLTGEFFHKSPHTFYIHFFEIKDSFEIQKHVQEEAVTAVLADEKLMEQIEFMLDHLSITWGERFPYDERVRIIARSFVAFDRFTSLEEFKKLPDSIKAQFTRYTTVRNFYRHIELHPKVTNVKRTPVLTLGYLRMVVNQQLAVD